jgi:hypothetical protein
MPVEGAMPDVLQAELMPTRAKVPDFETAENDRLDRPTRLIHTCSNLYQYCLHLIWIGAIFR